MGVESALGAQAGITPDTTSATPDRNLCNSAIHITIYSRHWVKCTINVAEVILNLFRNLRTKPEEGSLSYSYI